MASTWRWRSSAICSCDGVNCVQGRLSGSGDEWPGGVRRDVDARSWLRLASVCSSGSVSSLSESSAARSGLSGDSSCGISCTAGVGGSDGLPCGIS